MHAEYLEVPIFVHFLYKISEKGLKSIPFGSNYTLEFGALVVYNIR